MKFGGDEILMVPYKCCCFSARSVQGRIQGEAIIGHGGSPSSTNFFFRLEDYSKNRMHSNHLEAFRMKYGYLWFHSVVKLLKRFDVLLDLSHIDYFNAISIDFYAVKC